MNLSVLAITFGLIFVAELPDKTMIATIVMASRYRPLPVLDRRGGGHGASTPPWPSAPAGSSSSSPTAAVEAVVAALFAGGALYLILVKETAESTRASSEADQRPLRPPRGPGAFAVIVVAELGDLTQILTANLVARYHDALVGLRRARRRRS